VATYSTGISVTWNGTPFVEVQELAYNIGGTRTGRAVAYPANQGQISVGTRAQLVVSGGDAGLTTYAIWESVAVAPTRNGVTSYTVTFRITDDV
jgi:hypothetical protein